MLTDCCGKVNVFPIAQFRSWDYWERFQTCMSSSTGLLVNVIIVTSASLSCSTFADFRTLLGSGAVNNMDPNSDQDPGPGSGLFFENFYFKNKNRFYKMKKQYIKKLNLIVIQNYEVVADTRRSISNKCASICM